MVLRKKIGQDLWHFCMNCREWPLDQFVEMNSKDPPRESICQQCKEKQRNNECSAAGGMPL